MAGAVQLTEVDFDQIKTNLVNYLKSTKKFTDYDFEGSNLSVILNLIAYQSQLSAYSTNMIANESFLATSTVRRNVVSNARQIGYFPNSTTSAVTTADFSYDLNQNGNMDELYPFNPPSFVEINPGVVFRVANSSGAMNFNVLDPVRAVIDQNGVADFRDVNLYEGTLISYSFVVDKSIFNQKFVLENFNIDISSLRVEVKEVLNQDATNYYRQANSLVDVNEEDRVYWVEEVDNSYYELTFGDGHFGKELADGSEISVTYLISNGDKGNGVQNTNSLVYSGRAVDSFGTKLNFTPTVRSLAPSHGGAEKEDVSTIKFRAPKNYAAQSRCVTAIDYETIIRKIYSGVEAIYVFGGEEMPVPEYGRVYIVVKPLASDYLSTSAKVFIKDSIRPFRVASLDLIIKDPDILNLEVDTTAYYDVRQTRKDQAAIRSDIITLLKHYSDSPELKRFGGNAKYSKIVGAIDDADPSIQRNTTSLRMMKSFPTPINTLATFEVCFENSLEIDNNNAVIYSTGFKMTGDDRLYNFENKPQTGFERMGTIRLFYFNEFNEKIIVRENFGTVDYSIGEVYLGMDEPISISETTVGDSRIEIRAIPIDSGKEVTASKSVYMRMNIDQSNIAVVVSQEVN